MQWDRHEKRVVGEGVAFGEEGAERTGDVPPTAVLEALNGGRKRAPRDVPACRARAREGRRVAATARARRRLVRGGAATLAERLFGRSDDGHASGTEATRMAGCERRSARFADSGEGEVEAQTEPAAQHGVLAAVKMFWPQFPRAA